ncbi:N5-glutamine methyltransferase family protein [Armatimonas sp.]|uniref:N5-glutamine methyltransferase family protein n=1 Tax=Armatimonas sp. TaxID=1872638 RepID=UPI00374FF736
MVTLRELLTAATERLTNAGIPAAEARGEARMLVQHAFGLTREQLILRSDSPVIGGQGETFEALLTRRASREPLAYILGERAFYGLGFRVTPAVLIPRPETEHLVEAVTGFLPTMSFLPPPARLGSPPPPADRSFLAAKGDCSHETCATFYPLREAVPRGCPGREQSSGERQSGERQILDIGTGSGCIAITLAKLLPDAQVWATDISEAALEIAQENAARHGVQVTFCRGDLLAPLPPEQRFSVIVSNPPYIAPSEASTLEPEVRDFEPHTALFDPLDLEKGLSFYRRLASEAPARLMPGGLLVVEVGQGQDEAVAQLWRDAGLVEVTITPDLAGIGRVVSGRTP